MKKMTLALVLTFLLGAAQVSYGERLRIEILDPQGDNSGAVDVLKMDMIIDDSSGNYAITVTSNSKRPFNGACKLNVNIWNPSVGHLFQDTLNTACPTENIFRTSGNDIRLTEWQAGQKVASSSGTELGNPPGSSWFRTSVHDFPETNCVRPFPNICDEDAIGAQRVFYVVGLAERVDQHNFPLWRGGSTNIQSSNQVGQSFQPSCRNLVSVDVDLIHQVGLAAVTVKILRDGSLISPVAQAQTSISEDGLAHFILDSAVSVTPGETLILQLESAPFHLPLWKYATDTYPHGTRWFSGNPQTGDFFFRTYSTSCPKLPQDWWLVVNDSFRADDGTNLNGWTPDVSDNGSAWEVIEGLASIRDKALAFSSSGATSTPLLNARNVIQEIEFDFTLGGNNAFFFYPLRTGNNPRTGFGFWVNQRRFDFKKFTGGKETAVRTIRMDFDVQKTYTAKFSVRGKRLSLYIKKRGGRYGPDLLNITDPDYRYLTYLGFARSSAENARLRIDNVKVAVDPLVRDSDGDGVADPADAFPRDPTETRDTDGDGRGDNTDAFPKDPGEWVDTDGDGVGNNADAFPRDPSESKDSDRDGVGDNTDVFPKDPSETQDSDKDGVGDNADAFPKDPSETKDSDKDSVGDNADAFPKDPSEHRDRDGDGVGDNADAFPGDPSESKDSDGDGVGDNADAFPRDPSEHRDRDGDGVGDNADAFPRDPSESRDSDGDGVGDNADVFPRDPSETQDSDGDGVGDSADAFPEDPKETEDSDGDGLGDGLEGDIGSDPLDADTDDDGLDDGFEHDEGLDPNDGSDCPEWICGVSQRGWRLGL